MKRRQLSIRVEIEMVVNELIRLTRAGASDTQLAPMRHELSARLDEL